MKLSCTVFEILSLIFQKYKRSRDNDHDPFTDNLSPDLFKFLSDNISLTVQDRDIVAMED